MKYLISSTILCLFAGMLTAQFRADLNLSLGLPVQDFRENTDAVGFGGDINLLFPVSSQNSAIQFGLNADYLVYGFNSQDETLIAQITANGTVIDELIVPLEIKTTNNIFGLHGVLQVEAPLGKMRPYARGMFGFRRISTDTRILDRSNEGFFVDDDDDSDVISRKNNLQDWVWSYGGGGGLHIGIGTGVYLNLGATYLIGGNAEYYDGEDTEQWEINFVGFSYDRNNLDPGDLEVTATPKRSRTNMVLFELGLHFNFGEIDMDGADEMEY